MRLRSVPRPLSLLVASLLLIAQPAIANPQPHRSAQAGFSYNQLFARWECDGTQCGYYNQVCCSAGTGCFTNVQSQATCTPNTGSAATTAVSGGYWQYYTTTYVETDLATITSVISSYVAGATAAACNYANYETPCGSTCCQSGYYCYSSGTCVVAPDGGSSGYYSSLYTTPGAPLRGTSSALTVVTATASPTTTVPFVTPVATGATVTISESEHHGLSGGAIAGIVIGVLLGIILLALICFYCCIRGMIHTFLGIFGLGRQRKTVEVEEYERRSHHASGGAAAAGAAAGAGRTWFGTRRPPPRQEKQRNEVGTLIGIGAGLAALWAFLGLKRRRENRQNEEKYSEYSYDSQYYSSQSSASTVDRRDDRRVTRETRDYRRESVSRR